MSRRNVALDKGSKLRARLASWSRRPQFDRAALQEISGLQTRRLRELACKGQFLPGNFPVMNAIGTQTIGEFYLIIRGKEAGMVLSFIKEAHVPDSVEKQLEALPSLSRADLSKLWQQLFNSAPDPKIRRPAMIRFVSYRIQEQTYGSLSATSERRLRHLAGATAGVSNLKISSAPKIRPGTRLVREWQDQVHLVNVENKGYEYRGARYRSLSEIARQITGTRWSGPLFFGIKSKQDNRTAKEIQ
jgi:hypothetical protein